MTERAARDESKIVGCVFVVASGELPAPDVNLIEH
jgi:hypothetical protein